MNRSLDRVLLSWPTSIPAVELSDGNAHRSWIQVAKTGDFVSKKYGRFSITKQDLAQMFSNFKTITPVAPTQLAVDYDHLSMSPTKVGDGAAAGWFHDLELRADGAQLWGEVEWTPDAAERIRKKEYRYVSPSFAKNHQSKTTGQSIGTTLLAAAITNHPFLEGMEAVTLSDDMVNLAFPQQFLKKKAGDDEDDEEKDEPDANEDTEHDDPDVAAAAKQEEEVATGDPEAQAEEAAKEWAPLEAAIAGQANGAKTRVIDVTDDIATWRQNDATFRAKFTNQNGSMVLGTPEPVSVRIVPLQQAQMPGAPGAPAMNQPPGMNLPPTPMPMRPGEKHMSETYKLSDVKGNEVEVSEETLRSLSEKLLPAGSVVMPATEVKAMNEQITSLNTQVADLATSLAAEAKSKRLSEMDRELGTLLRAGRITPKMSEWAKKQFADQVDLAAFNEWIGSVPSEAIVNLNKSHGSGVGVGSDADDDPSGKIMATAQKIVTEKKIDLRDAIIEASVIHANEAHEYLDGHRPHAG